MKAKWIFAFALAPVMSGLTSWASIAQTHNNGLGQDFAFSAPLGAPGQPVTYSFYMAFAAAKAWPFSGTIGSTPCGKDPGAPHNVYKKTATSCAVWVYTKDLAGYVRLTQGDTCRCPTISDPTWK
jgi:hypothetical protein